MRNTLAAYVAAGVFAFSAGDLSAQTKNADPGRPKPIFGDNGSGMHVPKVRPAHAATAERHLHPL